MNEGYWEVLKGYSETKSGHSFVFCPQNAQECIEVLDKARAHSMSVCSRGNGLSYGDMALNDKNIVLDTKNLSQIHFFDPKSKIIRVGPGVTYSQVLNLSLQYNLFLPGCPGESEVTIGGGLANNVHGKDTWKNGTLGSSTLKIKMCLSNGTICTASPQENSDLFYASIGGSGLTGIFLEIELKLIKIPSAYVVNETVPVKNLEESLEIIEESRKDFDFVIAWVDCFATGKDLGRGVIYRGRWIDTQRKPTANELKQSLKISKYFLKIIPFNFIWFCMRPFFGGFLMKYLNAIKYYLTILKCKLLGNMSKEMLFTDFNYMHKKIPNFKHVYRPHGFHEFQPLIPRDQAKKGLREIMELCQKWNFQSLLCAIKPHRKDNFMISYQGDGYSFGIDVSAKGRKKSDIRKFTNQLFEKVINLNGLIFIAKDEWLTQDQMKRMYKNYETFIDTKKKYDSKYKFTSDLYYRLYH